jgi:hypothetical protein
MSSYSSDQTTLNKTTGVAAILRAGRSRVTSIQGRGEVGSVLSLHDVADAGDAAAGNLKAIYRYETEGLEVYVPGSGILFVNGLCATLTQTTGSDGSVTLTITGG